MSDRENVITQFVNYLGRVGAYHKDCSKGCDVCMPLHPNDDYCDIQLLDNVLTLLKEQEPRLVDLHDFDNADCWGNIPAWCEYNPSFGIKTIDAWKIITMYNLRDKDARYWTHRPTEDQRKAVKWDEQ